MRCPHCDKVNSEFLPFTLALENGRAYAQSCVRCGHILGIRPRLHDDPPAGPPDLTPDQLERLRFTRWRVGEARTRPTRIILPGTEEPPLTAA